MVQLMRREVRVCSQIKHLSHILDTKCAYLGSSTVFMKKNLCPTCEPILKTLKRISINHMN